MIRKFIFVLILNVISASWQAHLVHGQEEVAAPSLKNGDFWHYKARSNATAGVSTEIGVIPDGAYIIRFTAGRGIQVYNLVGDKEAPIDISAAALFNSFIGRVREGSPRRSTPNSQNLAFPLFVGKKWQYVWELPGQTRSGHRPVTIEVLGRERMETPAGSFQVFKIEKYIQWARAGPRFGTTVESVRAIYFYSPETKSIVIYSSEGSDGSKLEYELIKFGSSGGAG